MLKSKLLTVFIAFALVITIGGVYATWAYPSANLQAVTPKSANVVATIDSASVETGTVPGTLAITDTSLAYHIENTGDYKTGLSAPTGGVTVEYTPSTGSEYNTVDMICTIRVVAQKYDGKDIFKINNPAFADGALVLKKSAVGSGAAAWTITDADIQLALTEVFQLNTMTEWNEFKLALDGTSVALDFTVDTNTAKN